MAADASRGAVTKLPVRKLSDRTQPAEGRRDRRSSKTPLCCDIAGRRRLRLSDEIRPPGMCSVTTMTVRGRLGRMRFTLLTAAAMLLFPASVEASVRFPPDVTYGAGAYVKVTVEKRPPTVLVFSRLSDRGKVLRVIDLRRLRREAVTLQFGRPGKYELRVGNAKRRYTVGSFCAREDGNKAELRLASSTVPLGGTVHYRIVNTSTNFGCVTAGASYAFDRRQPDGSWVAVEPPPLFGFPLIAYGITPWKPFDKQAALAPLVTTPGRYRLRDRVHYRTGIGTPTVSTAVVELSAELEVR